MGEPPRHVGHKRWKLEEQLTRDRMVPQPDRAHVRSEDVLVAHVPAILGPAVPDHPAGRRVDREEIGLSDDMPVLRASGTVPLDEPVEARLLGQAHRRHVGDAHARERRPPPILEELRQLRVLRVEQEHAAIEVAVGAHVLEDPWDRGFD